MKLLLVDDDRGLRELVRATFESFDVAVDEAENAARAYERIRAARPDVIVLDVLMPGQDGLAFCRRLKDSPATRDIRIVVLSGSDGGIQSAAEEAGADAFVRKPFSPLELLAVAEGLAGQLQPVPVRSGKGHDPQEQLGMYARDLRHLLELERGQRALLESAYRETVSALATALETKDTGTRAHSQRVQLYAAELAATMDRELGENPSVEYGFLLHDVGKIGIPDRILLKRGPLSPAERRRMETHTELGEQMLGEVAFLKGEGVQVVRSHHERWDGSGYPDGLAGENIPLPARVFAVADALDAMTSDRPYRNALAWARACDEIVAQSAKQFDPFVVEAFQAREGRLHEIHRELSAVA